VTSVKPSARGKVLEVTSVKPSARCKVLEGKSVKPLCSLPTRSFIFDLNFAASFCGVFSAVVLINKETPRVIIIITLSYSNNNT